MTILAALPLPVRAQADPAGLQVRTVTVSVRPGFLEELPEPGKGAKPAEDLSGIACRPAGPEAFRCLVVNDESQFAQWAGYRDRVLTPETATLRLIGKAPPGPGAASGIPDTLGTCPGGAASFKEFDGEGVAWEPGPTSGGTFYITGSHSCGRSNPRLRQSTHLLARVEIGGGEPKVSLSWRLGPSLRAEPTIGASYNRPLTRQEQGLDIEGIAAIDGELFFGLRAPAEHAATILRAPARALFAPATPPEAPVPLRAHRIPLGERAGVRDLAALPGNRLLVLSGPSQGPDQMQVVVPQGLHVVQVGEAAEWQAKTLVGRIAPPPGQQSEAKAEGIAVLHVDDDDVARVLILYEKPGADAALEMRLPLH